MKISVRILSVVLVIAMLTGIVSAANTGVPAAEKEETVYIMTAADGSVNKIIVSDWLKNADDAATLSDKTSLENVENIDGDETFTFSGNDICTWDANGNDIYYQGTSTKSLPVDMRITYQLDGKPISAQELAGKSGRVTMRFDYTNNETATVTIDGKKETVSVPFVMLTGMILDNSTFTNISVTNGRLVNDGSRCIVMGVALPGLRENLQLSNAKLTIPDYVEITADVTNFELTTTLTLATNSIFNKLQMDKISDLDSLNDALNDLLDASLQLVEGSSDLSEGLDTLLEKSGELSQGIDQLLTGSQQLSDGASALNAGVGQLSQGMESLNSGLQTLAGNSQTLNAGARQVFDSLLAMADSQLAAAGLNAPKLTIDNYNATLNSVLANLDSNAVYNMAYNTALSQVTEAVNAQQATIRAQVTAAVQNQVFAAVLANLEQPMTVEEYQAAVAAGQIPPEMQEQINAAVAAQMSSADVQAQIDALTADQINQLINQTMQSADIQAQISAAVAQAEAGAGSIQNLLTQLNSYRQFYQGVLDYTAGVSTAYSGSQKLLSGVRSLQSGASSLVSGSKTLYSGIGTLKTGSQALIEGVTQLDNGAHQLSDGMQEFHAEGIQKMVDTLQENLFTVLTRLQATIDASNQYQIYTDLANGTTGSVKFIYRTESISADGE